MMLTDADGNPLFEENCGFVSGWEPAGPAGAPQSEARRTYRDTVVAEEQARGGVRPPDPNQVIPITVQGWTVIVKAIGQLQRQADRLEKQLNMPPLPPM